ncbi:MAG: hypothetical protein GX270_14480 [Clostridiaceae bacterium]|nr:hypothetical protein [Clostridiaceae bacterium]
MKKIISLVVSIMIFTTMLFVPVQAKSEAKDNGKEYTINWLNTFQVTASSLNIRSGPGRT